LTLAQVHIHEFDPQFRLECQRMAVRERQRREERKAARAKAKAAAAAAEEQANGTYAPGTRRSARNNGQQPEITITDPLELERKLKRQRSSESGAESHGSGAEGGERSSKRARFSGDEGETMVDGSSSIAAILDAAMPNGLPSSEDQLMTDVSMEVETITTVAGPSGTTQTIITEHIEESYITVPAVESASSSLANLLNPAEPTVAPIYAAPAPEPSAASSPGPTVEPTMPIVEPETLAPAPSPPKPRTPSPSPGPPPVFQVDENLLSQLSERLVSGTGSLTVEQLEQLRAACFDCVWRRRSEWDRDDALRELLSIVDEFLEEVVMDDDMSSSP